MNLWHQLFFSKKFCTYSQVACSILSFRNSAASIVYLDFTCQSSGSCLCLFSWQFLHLSFTLFTLWNKFWNFPIVLNCHLLIISGLTKDKLCIIRQANTIFRPHDWSPNQCKAWTCRHCHVNSPLEYLTRMSGR